MRRSLALGIAVLSAVSTGACMFFDRGVQARPIGAWRIVRQGEGEGVRWTWYEAKATQGGTCTSIVTDPDLGGVWVKRGQDGSSRVGPRSQAPVHEGRRANCIPQVVNPADVEDEERRGVDAVVIVDIDLPARGDGEHYMAVRVAADASNLVAVFDDATTVPLTPEDGRVFLRWSGARRVSFLDVDLPRWAGPLRCGGSDERPIYKDLAGMSCYSKGASTPSRLRG